jgi:hypothetical protein
MEVQESGNSESAAVSSESEGMTLAQYVCRQLEIVSIRGKTNREIAAEAGYKSGNIISMIKSGAMKLPLSKVPEMARALKSDPALLFRLAMMQFTSDKLAVEEIFGTVVSKNETAILGYIRELTEDSDPEFTPALRIKLNAAFTEKPDP